MAQVTITLTDTEDGGVSVHTDFNPGIGAPCSTAQAAALDIISRTRKSFGLDKPVSHQHFPRSANLHITTGAVAIPGIDNNRRYFALLKPTNEG